MLLENLHNDSFIAKRIVYKHMKSKDPQPSKLRKDILCDKSHKRYVALQLLPSQNIRQLLRIKKKKKWFEG